MARTINKIELLGRVGTDPEMRYTPNGTVVVQLRLATERCRLPQSASLLPTSIESFRCDYLLSIEGTGGDSA